MSSAPANRLGGIIVWLGGIEEKSDRALVAAQRVGEVLDRLAAEGRNQSEVARQLRLPRQFLSDVRNRRRPVSELFARRLGELAGVEHRWLLGIVDSPTRQIVRPAGGWGARISLPLLTVPVMGEPREDRHWNGAVIELAGVAAAKAMHAVRPYVLQYGNPDHGGRLRRDDLVLITQSAAEKAELSVVRDGKKLFLARRVGGQWIRAATNKPLGSDCIVAGKCLGVVWSAMT